MAERKEACVYDGDYDLTPIHRRYDYETQKYSPFVIPAAPFTHCMLAMGAHWIVDEDVEYRTEGTYNG